MATSFADTPKWFDAEYYMSQKLAQLIEADPKGNWTRESLNKNFSDNGFDNPYDHYKAFGDIENLSANTLFNNAEYLAAKAALNGSTWTIEMVAKDIHDHGLTLMEHYIQFGGKYENLNPSSNFSQDKYFEAKLDLMQTSEPDKGWTLDKVKESFANAGITALEHFLTYGKVEGLDKFDYSVNGDPIPHPGNTNIVLTTGADTVTKDATVAELKTTDRDDVISGVVSTLASTGTFNAGDVIDGGAGVDTLKLDMKTNFTYKSGSVKNVEHIVLDNATGKSFDAKGVEKALTYTVDGGDKGTTAIKNVDSTETGYMLTQDTGKFDVQINDSALTGKTDTVNLWLQGVGTGTADADRVILDVRGTTNTGKVEGLNLIANGKDNFVTLAEKHETLSVFGEGNLDVKTVADLKSFDATTASGKIVADFTKALTTLKTINGGTADDTFTVGALANTAVVNGGEGNDTLKFGTLADTTVIKSTITGVETFEVAQSASGDAMTFDLSKVDGLETFKIGGAATTAGTDTYTLKNATSYDSLDLQISNELASGGSVVYDGNGMLNVSLNGDTTNAQGTTTLASLNAKNITELNIANAAETSNFTVTTVDAVNATSLTVDTGDYSGKMTFTGTSQKLNKVASITFEGGADASFTFSNGSVNSKLASVNAENLDGKLTLDLTNANTGAVGVEVIMGKGGTDASTGLKGSLAGADTYRLGDGNELVFLDGNTVADDVYNFGKSGTDTLDVGLAGTGVYTKHTNKVAATASIFWHDGDVANATALAGADTTYFNAAASTLTGYALFTDANDTIGIYKVDATTSSVNLSLLGVLHDVDITTLSAATFV